ncbi:nuclear transport factor 2 family protein [Streptomyces colonosanans]
MRVVVVLGAGHGRPSSRTRLPSPTRRRSRRRRIRPCHPPGAGEDATRGTTAVPGPRLALATCRRDNAMDPDIRTRAALEEHWRASERGDTEAEHAIYAADAVLDYPQSGERFRGRATISAQRGGHPASRHFTVDRIVGSGDLWVSECVITYDGVPAYSVSIMEFAHGHVVHETQYFADAFGAPEWRTALAEPMPGTRSNRP